MNARTRLILIGPIAGLILTACAGDRFEYTPVGEMQDGPGMFTGEDGEAVFSLNLDERDSTGDTDPPSGDYEEFLQYQAFREWKENAEGTDDYREFQLWLEWREQRANR